MSNFMRYIKVKCMAYKKQSNLCDTYQSNLWDIQTVRLTGYIKQSNLWDTIHGPIYGIYKQSYLQVT
jgi:hypothetical protein